MYWLTVKNNKLHPKEKCMATFEGYKLKSLKLGKFNGQKADGKSLVR
jgi:hypothetical protein